MLINLPSVVKSENRQVHSGQTLEVRKNRVPKSPTLTNRASGTRKSVLSGNVNCIVANARSLGLPPRRLCGSMNDGHKTLMVSSAEKWVTER